jgi:hypothetical protein
MDIGKKTRAQKYNQKRLPKYLRLNSLRLLAHPKFVKSKTRPIGKNIRIQKISQNLEAE